MSSHKQRNRAQSCPFIEIARATELREKLGGGTSHVDVEKAAMALMTCRRPFLSSGIIPGDDLLHGGNSHFI